MAAPITCLDIAERIYRTCQTWHSYPRWELIGEEFSFGKLLITFFKKDHVTIYKRKEWTIYIYNKGLLIKQIAIVIQYFSDILNWHWRKMN